MNMHINPEGMDWAERHRNANARNCKELLRLLVKHHGTYNPRNLPVIIYPSPIEIGYRLAVSRAAQRAAELLAQSDYAPWFVVVEEFVKPRPTVKLILKEVARHYGIKKLDLLSHRRTQDIARPRQVAMYLAKTLTLKSLPDIGRRIGGRDHTTVLHGVRKITKLMTDDVDIRVAVESVTAKFAEAAE